MAYPPDSMLDVDVADELAELLAQFRGQLSRHHAAGSWAAPGGLTARPAPSASVTSDVVAEEVHDETVAPSRIGRASRGLPQVRAELGECTRCKLSSTRKSIVFGVGAEDAPLMFVGEAPGEKEDKR